ncbi:MAG: FlgD immunoglobulin-like domain containing protein, partial [bacterium]
QSTYDWHQLVIYDTTLAAPDGNSVFTYQYLTANNYGSTTVGINDSTTATGIQVLYNGSYHRGAAPLAPGMAVKFTTVEPRVGLAGPAPDRVPTRLTLEPCRPNPARGSARLSFSLPAPADARLAVYDATGRRVRELFRGPTRAGSQVVRWDGRDDRGQPVARGVYLYRLEAGGESIARKLVLTD